MEGIKDETHTHTHFTQTLRDTRHTHNHISQAPGIIGYIWCNQRDKNSRRSVELFHHTRTHIIIQDFFRLLRPNLAWL